MYARRNRPVAESRGRVLAAVRELLAEGAFHTSTVEEVATRAGVSRATVYQQFGSRLGLVDAICESFDLSDVAAAEDVDTLITRSVEFWAREEKLLAELYGAAAVDPAARAFVERQTRDRYRHLQRVSGVPPRRLWQLALLTSFETYLELRRRVGLPAREVAPALRAAAAELLGRSL